MYHTISLIGLVICCIGEILRKAAILTAKSNFNHLVSKFIFLFSKGAIKSNKINNSNYIIVEIIGIKIDQRKLKQ